MPAGILVKLFGHPLVILTLPQDLFISLRILYAVYIIIYISTHKKDTQTARAFWEIIYVVWLDIFLMV